MSTLHIVILGALAWTAGGCGDDTFSDTTPVCLPASTAACDCPTGAAGAKVCADNGLEYGACACLPDAGTPDASDAIDAGVDAPTAPAAVGRSIGS